MLTLTAVFPSVEALSPSSPVENAPATMSLVRLIATGNPIGKPRPTGSVPALR